ncbi:hypothetical protein [uncultured Jannaschia sp.]|uniref:hypothetical protein n=1 Tax=uncultured Jannaschia sp. TaxID=293347 RepID=UPI00261040EF|nr:hypothetical protein [uncultured Jannaschia sp.]
MPGTMMFAAGLNEQRAPASGRPDIFRARSGRDNPAMIQRVKAGGTAVADLAAFY